MFLAPKALRKVISRLRLSCGACCACWSVQRACIKLQQFIGVLIPSQEGRELSRADVFPFPPDCSSGLEHPLVLWRLIKPCQSNWFVEESCLFLLPVISPKGQSKTWSLSYLPSSLLLLRSLLLFRMLQSVLFFNASFNPLISDFWNVAGGNKNRARLFHDIPFWSLGDSPAPFVRTQLVPLLLGRLFASYCCSFWWHAPSSSQA